MTLDRDIDSTHLQQIAHSVVTGQPWAAYQMAARALDRIPSDRIQPALRARVALLGSSTLEPFLPVLRVEAARLGLWLDTYLAPYGQYISELLEPHSALYRFQPQATFVAIDSDVLWNQCWAETALPQGEPVVAGLLTPLFAGLDHFARIGTGIVVINDFIPPRRTTEGVNAFRKKGTFAHTVAHANKQLRLYLTPKQHTFLFPLADVVAQVGRDHAFHWRNYYRGHVMWSNSLMAAVAEQYVGYALSALGKATKCIVLDLDDTLWGGVIGEDGLGGIELGPQWPGSEFLDFQRELLGIHRQGILLAVCSKNNEQEALAVLRGHPNMLIREEQLAAYRINWEDKATNIRSLAQELNISMDHMLLIDDNPHERAWVRQQIPQLRVPEMPSEPSLYPSWVGSLPSLIVLQQTSEDLQRTRQYQDSRTREAYRESVGSMEDFLRGLRIRVEVTLVTDQTMGRVVQLLAKTNQFNLTTRRHDEMTVRRQVKSGAWRVYTMRVADRFGDFGLTAVAIVSPGAKVWHLDSFLMSCRVIGKSVETALLAQIVTDARAHGASELSAEFLDSGRNQVASTFLGSQGFVQSEGEERWVLSLVAPAPQWPEWIEAVEPNTSEADAVGRARVN